VSADSGVGCESFWNQSVKERRALQLTASQKQTADGACRQFLIGAVDVRYALHEPWSYELQMSAGVQRRFREHFTKQTTLKDHMLERVTRSRPTSPATNFSDFHTNSHVIVLVSMRRAHSLFALPIDGRFAFTSTTPETYTLWIFITPW
jgi:hypothetical protein